MASQTNDTQLSKTLSWILRHGAHKCGFHIAPDGFIAVNDILRNPQYEQLYSLDTLRRLVKNDAKQRYTLKRCDKTDDYFIKANQGHSMRTVDPDRCLRLIVSVEEVPLAVHGTYYSHWPQIRREGLRCMGRNHVHFATVDTLKAGTSGFRHNCELLIYLNVLKAMTEGGMKLYRSENNVILTAGIEGRIVKEYFLKVVDRKTQNLVEF